MSYNINYKLYFAAMALLLATTQGQKAWAVLPLDAEQNQPAIVPLIPDEISLNDTSNANDLLAPPTLNNNPNSPDKGSDVIPLDSANNLETGIQELNLPEQNEPVVLPGQGNTVSDAKNSSNEKVAPLAAKSPSKNLPTQGNEKKDENALKFQQLQLLKQQATTPESNNFGEAILSQIDNDLFNQMSDLEKQTSLLSLELRREKVKNEIEALKAARQKSIDDANAQKEEKKRKQLEWEQEQQRKLLVEEQKLRELNLAYEKLRQENVIKAYKEEMLLTNQAWIDNNIKLYDELTKMEESHSKQVKDLKLKLNYLLQLSEKASEAAETAKQNYSRELTNLQTQISILKSRLEAEKVARQDVSVGKDKANPFASMSENAEQEKNKSQKLSDEYAIMEIRGQGSELSAKLINKNGSSFLVQKGTVLQTGHKVDEITQTYITAVKDGKKEYLYFAAGGILDREPKAVSATLAAGVTPLPKNKSKDLEPLPALSTSQGLPIFRLQRRYRNS